MTKAEWAKLAQAYADESGYWDELYSAKRELAKKHHIETDFIGNDYFFGPLASVALEMLGDEFSYWFYDCERDFDALNSKITHPDGSHPDVHSLEDLYEYSRKEDDEGNR